MATGRGQLFPSFRAGLERKASEINGRGPTAKKTQFSSKKKENTPTERTSTHRCLASNCAEPVMMPHQTPAVRHPALARSSKHAVKPAACTQNHIARLPPEILMKILSYLDASSLFCIGFVNKLFYQLGNNNAMWRKMFSEYEKSKKWNPKLSGMDLAERPEGYWRRLYFSTMAGYNENWKWKRELMAINPYTGLPSQTERVLRNRHVTWEITVSDKRGCEGTFEQGHAYFSDSSVTVCWSSGNWPLFHYLSTLQLHGVMRVALNCPNLNRPGWRSLIAKFDQNTISKSGFVIGKDKLVNLVLLPPGVIIGFWRGQGQSIAFVMVNLHFHRLVERSLLGSSICPYSMLEDRPLFDDVDPNYGLHGYSLHIVLHNTVTRIMSGRFPQLYCRKDNIQDGFIPLNAINRNNLSQHTPLCGKISLPWKSDHLGGAVENCCMMSLTLLDESQNPFWCVSTPVSMVLSENKKVSYDYQGENFFINYQDIDGKVKMQLVWLEEQGQFFLISLVVFIAVAKVNKYFGREY